MNVKQTAIGSQKSPAKHLIVVAGMCVMFTIIQDFIRADLHQSTFYLSESFIFSTFWWIFVPMLYAQYFLLQIKNSAGFWFIFLLVTIPLVFHIIFYPLLIWIVSFLFYYHTFEIRQTFIYALSEYLYLLAFIYTIPLFIYLLFKPKSGIIENSIQKLTLPRQYTQSICLSEGNKHLNFAVKDIQNIVANPPYVTVRISGKNYLYSETLKSILEKIDPDQFIRVHKSSIVNINHVQFYKSRLNGDYDLTTRDGTEIRVSRNYARNFKEKLTESHQLDAK